MLLPITAVIDDGGMLHVGGCSAKSLKEKYGTPLYIMDVATIKKQCTDYISNFTFDDLQAEIIYASKAFSSLAICQLVASQGLSVDVSTGGELYMALASGFDPAKIYFHGNNKSCQEIEYGLESNVGTFIVDNLEELALLARMAQEKGKRQNIFLRITPGIKASTHEYIQTGKIESKFGFGIHKSIASQAVKQALSYGSLNLAGLHCHIGSQIFNLSSYEKMIDVMLKFMHSVNNSWGAGLGQLNIGGGLGISYTRHDKPPAIADLAQLVHHAVLKYGARHGVKLKKIYLEPGRSIVGNAGITLYEAGTIKQIPHVKNYLSVDGGMSDNIRPILYQAKYDAFLAERMKDSTPQAAYTIVGKHCESGDILIENIDLPIVNKGDLIAVTATGAYCYSMASNYNGQTKCAVVAVEEGASWPWIERQTYQDLVAHNKELYESK